MHTVIQTGVFLADCRRAGLSEEDIAAIVTAIAADPQAGEVIPGTGGARKRRFGGHSKGKSGGYRTASYFAGVGVPVVALALIDKGERSDISAADRNALKKELAAFASDYLANARKRVIALKRRTP